MKGHTLYDSTYMKCLECAKSLETKPQLVDKTSILLGAGDVGTDC